MKKDDNPKHDLIEDVIRGTADFATKAALSLVPGTGAIYEFAKFSVGKAQEYARQKQDQRIMDFHRMLIGDSDKWDTELAEQSIDDADFHALLIACTQDIEDEKTSLYATLAKNAALREIGSTDLRFFTLSLHELTYSQLHSMREAYIAKNNLLVPHSGPGNHTVDLSPENVYGHARHGRQIMADRGFTTDGTINSYGEYFIKSCYSSDDLEPESINLKKWRNPSLPTLLLCYEIGDPYIDEFTDELAKQLRSLGVKTTPVSALIRNSPLATSHIGDAILIFKDEPERVMEHIAYCERVISRDSLAIQISESFPAVLEPIKKHFKLICTVTNPDPVKAARLLFQEDSDSN